MKGDSKYTLEKKVVGRLPMDLAESKENDTNLSKRLTTLLLKIITIMLCIFLFFGVYFFVLWWLTSDISNLQNENIIVLTKFHKSSNATFAPEDFEIVLRLRNNTKGHFVQRKKRQVHEQLSRINRRKYNQNEKVKKIIAEHKMLCNEKSHRVKCKELMEKLRFVTNNNSHIIERKKKSDNSGRKAYSNHRSDVSYESKSISKKRHLKPSIKPINSHKKYYPHGPMSIIPAYHEQYHNDRSAQQLTDTCLLAKLMKQSFPHLHGVYDKPKFESLYPQTYSRQPMPNFISHFHDATSNENLPHPQDVEIEKLINFKRDDTSDEVFNITIRENRCQKDELPCDNGEACIDSKQWCDGIVHCSDVSDELRCSCKDRVDAARICDGYFDCPLGEDEMGCFGCNENEFSCSDEEVSGTCFSQEQRCNNHADCLNFKDEMDCMMLSPKLHVKPLFAISHTEGFLKRNFQGMWYSVCSNSYMWAHDACRRETGLIIRPPIIHMVKIDPTLQISYINILPGGVMETTDSCFNSSAVYVTCPDLLCGTRMQTNSLILRKNMVIENNSFGRNKRFLWPGRAYSNLFLDESEIEHRRKGDNVMNNSEGNVRGKRTETRVVGGRPSQPAAWPWAVALYRDGVFHCGGVIVNQNWIMSAAHCVHKFWQHYYEIRVGTLRRLSFSPQEQNHRVSHVIVNQKYSQEDMKNDISLLHVKPGIMFSRWVRPICLPSPDVAGLDWDVGPQPGTMCTAVGWGATAERGPDPDHLREVEVPITQCNHREDLAGNEICAGFVDGGKDACQGDSGGPLLCKNPTNAQQWYIAGIVSHGDGCGRKDEPGVYTRVSLFVSWIRDQISSKTLPSIQPKQECPGFRCDSGIAKCLPKKRMCDEIIDCLDGEDEINCDYKSTETLRDEDSKILHIDDHKTHNSDLTSMDLTQNITQRSSEDKSEDENNLNEHELKNNVHKININSNEAELQNSSKPAGFSENKSSESAEMSSENVTNDPDLVISKEAVEQFTTQSNTISFTQDTNLHESLSNEQFFKETTMTTTEKISFIEDNVNNDTNEISTSENNLQLQTTETIIFDNEQPLETTTFSNNLSNENKLRSKDFRSFNDTCQIDNCNKTKVTHLENLTNATNNESLRGDTITNKGGKPLEDEKIFTNLNESESMPKIEPAKPKRTFIFPSEFECARIQQSIPYQLRCNQKADCEDGTDETGCTCTDYLATFESNLICDGNIDCSDGQDEIDCFECDNNQYLCKQDSLCIPLDFVCDGERQCPSGEDEIDCLTLSNGKEVNEFNGKAVVNLQGYITRKRGNSWHILCKEMMSIDLQEEAANYVCRYMGFSSANSYSLKHINIRESDLLETEINRRNRRNVNGSRPVFVVYKDTDQGDNLPRNVIIREPEVIKEHCVPNITKTCMTMYVVCDHTLFTHFEVSDNIMSVTLAKSAELPAKIPKEKFWPWVAKLYVDGNYKCIGVLIDLSWVLISNSCLQKTVTSHNYISVVLGSQKTMESIVGPYEQTYKVDAKKEFYRSKVTLLHLKEAAKYSTMVKPMVISTPYTENNNSTCIVVEQNQRNDLFTLRLREDYSDCNFSQRCFSFESTENIICEQNFFEESGSVVICHSNNGWYPAASYINKLACDSKRIVAYEIEHLKYEIKHIKDIAMSHLQELKDFDNCLGIRCPRGRCIELNKVCDGVPNCEDQSDESKDACQLKKTSCADSPFQRGCECLSNELKCRNGRCIDKELFKNGHDDCGDGTDEPGNFRCSDYLSRVIPARLCDGILNCKDRSDEDPSFCKCFAKQSFDCRGGNNNENYCVAMDMVCDGVRDCPNGEDESKCLALHAPKGNPNGAGEVVVRSHGIWHSKCYQTQNHTKSELENICRELGFVSGHSKQLTVSDNLRPYPYNNVILDDFSEITLNDKTSVKLRNTHLPIAKPVNEVKENCYPLFLECL
ncbi:serine protease nudel [Aricia agestis]|uniref:serine protease nudel n=1 Tax=Aricia agestis TaxID=91739 RepID=UPI001C205A0D|nr:serine protease nudel [Aricia agestis]XP_041970501.1 serine protease nudel [Aricia agestis]